MPHAALLGLPGALSMRGTAPAWLVRTWVGVDACSASPRASDRLREVAQAPHREPGAVEAMQQRAAELDLLLGF